MYMLRRGGRGRKEKEDEGEEDVQWRDYHCFQGVGRCVRVPHQAQHPATLVSNNPSPLLFCSTGSVPETQTDCRGAQRVTIVYILYTYCIQQYQQ